MEDKFNMKRIAGTLKYGWFDGEKKKYIIPAYIALALAFIGVGIGLGLTMIILNIQEQGGVEGVGDIFAILGCLFISVFPTSILGLLIYKNEKNKKEIELWLNDAVELTAYVRQLGVIQSGLAGLYKIQVEFEYEGQHYKYESRGKQLSASKFTYGYHNVWKDYVDRNIDILYSPRYKEVVLLKSGNKEIKD